MATGGSVPPSEEARIHHMSNLESSGEPAGTWAGWVTFASAVLVLLGCMHGFQGFLAMVDEGYFVARGEELVLVSYDAWGAILVLWGAVLLVVGAGLNARRSWARWLAAIVVMVDVIVQVGFFPSSPLLSLILITLDVVVLYALTVRWDEARLGGL
jgi:hypothetical protein